MTTQTLRRSKDRKVTNLTNGKDAAIGANSFGLPSGKAFSCPGQTDFCGGICYAGKLEKIYKGVRDVLMHNWELLQGKSIVEMEALLHEMISSFEAETLKQIAKGKPATMDFRIHWDGDFFSRDYAQAWANVIRSFPAIRFWVYTRSFVAPVNVIDIIAGIDNLSLYLSSDKNNIAIANRVAKQYNVKIAHVAAGFDVAADEIDSDEKKYKCPENDGRIALIRKKSACIACGICPDKRGHVLFSTIKTKR